VTPHHLQGFIYDKLSGKGAGYASTRSFPSACGEETFV
jgi:hypothetical protein